MWNPPMQLKYCTNVTSLRAAMLGVGQPANDARALHTCTATGLGCTVIDRLQQSTRWLCGQDGCVTDAPVLF